MTTMTNKFYDTSALIGKHTIDADENIIISSITLEELERIKSSNTAAEDLRMQVRHILNLLDANTAAVHYIIYESSMDAPFQNYTGERNNDFKIIACANNFFNMYPDGYFITNDRAQKLLAKYLMPASAEHIISEKFKQAPMYKGYIIVEPTDDELSDFYTNPNINKYELLINQYLVIKQGNKVIDTYVWNGDTHLHTKYSSFKSDWFGDIKPKQNDFSQVLAIDCLLRNQMTLLTGPAGSGKSLLSMSFLFQQLEKGKIDKIIIFCNPVATKDSARLGFYPGTRTDKLLDSQVGNFLSSKLGGREAVLAMIEAGTLVLLPFSDIRGFDTSGMHCGVYITEAQNLNINLLKLALQRMGEDCICIVEGDAAAQVDLYSYEGALNGMRRAAEVFKGESFFGAVELSTIHRSRIGAVADKM